LNELYEALDKSYIQGLTLTGGNPMDNILEVLYICRTVKEKFPTKDIWIYSGYTLEQLQQSQTAMCVLEYVDVLVDGPYIEKQRDISLKYRGSTNQRIINIPETLKHGQVVLFDA
jgi:anaerobic ribonucleoside-triphosphate reductase activating protein